MRATVRRPHWERKRSLRFLGFSWEVGPMAAPANPTTAPSCAPPHGRTRRRGQTLERAIFDAVLDQLQTVGYVGLTMEGVAARAHTPCAPPPHRPRGGGRGGLRVEGVPPRAHTGKAALYRRWPRKEDLVV